MSSALVRSRAASQSVAGKSSLLAILSQQPQLLPKKAAPRGRVGVTWADDIVDAHAVTPEASKDSLPNPHPTPMTGFDIMQLAPTAAVAGSKGRKATLGFVQQHDCLMPTLTVTETVLLGMMFREYVKGKEIDDAGTFVYALLKDLGLLGSPPLCLLVCSALVKQNTVLAVLNLSVACHAMA